MMKKLRFYSVFSLITLLFALSANAQTWESFDTPVTTNLILYDISFPWGQETIGFTGGSNVTYNGKGKILKTEDGGETWEVVWESEVNGTGVTSIYFETELIGFAGTMGGDVMKTIDGGINWTVSDIDADQDQGEITDMDFYDSDNGALISQWNGIYTTADGGDSWTQASTNYFGGQDLAYADATTLFVVGGEQKIYKSTDGGDTWIYSYSGPNANMLWYNFGVFFLDADNGVVTSEEGQTFITTDGGDSWTLSTIAGQYGLMHGAWMLDANTIYVCATPGEVFLSTNGGTTWTSDNPQDFDPSYYKVKFTSNGTGFVCGSGATGGTILRKLPTVDGVNEMLVTNLNIYPNPANDQITLSFDEKVSGNYTLNIISSIGKLMYSEEYSSLLGKNSIRIDLNHFSEGNYFISLERANEVVLTEKFQIVR